MEGLSQKLLENHFTLYKGYVTNTNTLSDTLGKMAADGKAGTPEYNELKRRFGWEFNGMRLHEIYFGNMKKGGAALDKGGALAKELASQFGSLENWEKDFRSTSAMRGIGWTVLALDGESKRMFNVWVNEHDVGHLAGTKPLLIIDVFEHAFVLDYGIKRADYIEAFMKAIDWSVVSHRFA
jgi:Fe-Mn family superoxide dismutase